MGRAFMRANLKALAVTALLATCLEAQTGHAGPVGPLTTFTSGTQAKASEVNGNFSAVKTAVDNNDSRLTALEGVNAASRITALESTVASLQTALTISQGQIAALQTLLQGVTRTTLNGQPTIQFSGMNV